MDERRALLGKLSRELEAMSDVIDSAYTVESPEVQEVPILSLHLNISEARLIHDMLKCHDRRRDERRA
jgi:hypothetical protein